MNPLVIGLVIHILVCIALWILMKMEILKCCSEDIVLSFFIPIFGPASSLIRSWFYRRQGRLTAKENGIEPLRIDSEIKKSIRVEDEENADSVVPISEALIVNNPARRRELVMGVIYDVAETLDKEKQNNSAVVPISEALLVNDSKERRRIIMDVLYSNPESFITQLDAAKKNEDSEVVHYAVTALVEIQKNFEQKFQLIQAQLDAEPDNGALLRSYQNLLEQYLNSGLLEGDSRTEQLYKLRDVVRKRTEKTPSMSQMLRLAKIDEELGDSEDLMQDAKAMIDIDPDNEVGYLFMIRVYALTRNREGIEEVIMEIMNRKIHVSSQGRAELRFWAKEPEKLVFNG